MTKSHVFITTRLSVCAMCAHQMEYDIMRELKVIKHKFLYMNQVIKMPFVFACKWNSNQSTQLQRPATISLSLDLVYEPRHVISNNVAFWQV